MILSSTIKNTAMLKRPVLEFVNEACLHSLPPKQSLFTFYTNTIPQQRYPLTQHSRTSRWIILIHVASSRGRSGWQEVNRDISTITGANSVRSRRVNGLYIQDMGNPFNVFVFVFLQKKVTASQKKHCNTRKSRSWKHLEEMTLCIHHHPGEEIVLLIGFDVPYALQRSLRQRKRTLE